MMSRKFFFAAALSLVITGCGNNTGKGSEEQQETVADHEHHHHDEGSSTSIELNNGEKWKVNDEMMVYVRQMEQEISGFKGTELADYKALSEKLKVNIDGITSSCTMKGKSHDELHKWLLPYIDLVKELSQAEDKNEAAGKLEAIKASIGDFNSFFN